MLTYENNRLHFDGQDVQTIAQTHGTPAYLYSANAIRHAYQDFKTAFAPLNGRIFYAIKANSSLGVLKLLADQGAGFDIVSGGELTRVLRAGALPQNIVFSGVGKSVAEIRAALAANIACFNVESPAELARINAIAAEMGMRAPISLRVNPDVDAKTHPYISTGLKENKFGIAIEAAKEAYLSAQKLANINIVGLDCHIGSQITELSPFVDALQRVLKLVDELNELGINFKHLDLGGGVGIQYDDETPPTPADYAAAIAPYLAGRDVEIWLEPGRAIVGNAGILLTQIEYLKPTPAKNFAIVDASMTELIRPSLYEAWHRVLPLVQYEISENIATQNWDIVGPVCESGDILAQNRDLALQAGDYVAFASAGAYGFVMSSNYNTRPRPPELLIEDGKVRAIRARETVEYLLSLENF